MGAIRMTSTRIQSLISAILLILFILFANYQPILVDANHLTIFIFGMLMVASLWFLYKGAHFGTRVKKIIALYTAASIIVVSIAEFIRFFTPVEEGDLRILPDILWIAHILLLSIGLALVLKRVRSNFQLSYLLFDLHISLTVFGSIWFVTYQNYVDNDQFLFETIYPLGALYVLFILGTLLLVIDKPIKRPVLNGLLVGLSICALSNVLLVIDSLDGTLFREKYLILYGLGMFTIASSFTKKEASNRKKQKKLFTISYSHWEIIRPVIQYAGVLILVYEFVFKYRNNDVLFVGMIVTIILVIGRDLITVIQNQSLVRRLKIFNQQLEKKIGERTRELTDSHRDLENAFKQIEYIARHDTFSRLPNRRYLEQMIEWKTLDAVQDRSMVALVFIDVDRLKHINDTVGHAIGDQLLLEIIERFQQKLPKDTFLARHGGDEFAVVLDGVYYEDDVVKLAQDLLDTVETPFYIQDKELTITLSIGISLYPDNSESIEDLMKHADLAMYKAKEERQNKIVFYSPEMDEELVGRMELLSELHSAIKRNEFIVYYQPQFDIHDGRLSGVEALVRWQHPVRGFISPGEFIPLAEEFDLIIPIDEIVIETAIAQFMKWTKQGIAPPRLSVNLCPQQFSEGDLAGKLKGLMDQYGFPPQKLMIEITESVAMNDEAILTAQLREIAKMGVLIAIDDFGTGYSSLSYVKNYPLNQLKIARPFIMDVPKSQSDIAMVKAIIDLSHHFHLTVVVEGVETLEQLNFLKSVHCEEVQGFYFAKPLSVQDIEERYLLPVKEGTSNG